MALLEVRSVSKKFGGVQALSNVTMEVEKGEVHALIGPNGAGKTTLFNCISSLYKPDGGEVVFKGENIAGMSAHRIPRLGVARTFQNLELFRNATVLDNIMLGRYMHKRTGFFSEVLFLPRVRKQEVEARRRGGGAPPAGGGSDRFSGPSAFQRSHYRAAPFRDPEVCGAGTRTGPGP